MYRITFIQFKCSSMFTCMYNMYGWHRQRLPCKVLCCKLHVFLHWAELRMCVHFMASVCSDTAGDFLWLSPWEKARLNSQPVRTGTLVLFKKHGFSPGESVSRRMGSFFWPKSSKSHLKDNCPNDPTNPHIHTNTHTCTHAHPFTCMHTNTHLQTQIHAFAHLHTHTHTNTHIHSFAGTLTHVHAYAHKHTHTHSHGSNPGFCLTSQELVKC